MKKIIFLFVLFVASTIFCNAQTYTLAMSTNLSVGTINNGDFEVSSEFENILKSIGGVNSTINYNIDKNVENSNNMKVLDVRFTKKDKTYLIGFEIGTPDDVSAYKGYVITHSCEGSCSSGATGVITYCDQCDFTYNGPKIVGCHCVNTGCCVHTKTATESASIEPTKLSDYIDTYIY